MATISTIRDGLNTNLATITSLQTYDTIPDKPEPPCAIVVPAADPFITRQTMGKGVVQLRFRVIVMVASAEDTSAQDKLDGYITTSGAGSVWVAIESDATLGGAAADTVVDHIRAYGDIEWNENRFWGAEFLVNVLATG